MKDYEKLSREHFDAMAENYDLEDGTYYSELPKKCCDAAAEVISGIAYDRLLDVGCGTDYLVRKLFSLRRAEYCGLDLSPEMLKKARAKFRESDSVSFTQGSSEKLPYKDETFDVLTCIMSFHHYPNPQNAVNEAYRVLKQGGTYIVADVDKHGYTPSEPSEVAAYDAEEMGNMMRTAGFSVTNASVPAERSYMVIAEKR